MSVKSKNLAYEAKEPAFLRRMRGEIGGRVEPEGERSAARLSRRGKIENDDDDDPTYVMDDNNTLSKEEYEALAGKSADKPDDDENEDVDAAKKPDPENSANDRVPGHNAQEHSVTEAGLNLKKRKAGKIIKDAPADEADDHVPKSDSQEGAKSQKAKKPKKKAIKLSFDAE